MGRNGAVNIRKYKVILCALLCLSMMFGGCESKQGLGAASGESEGHGESEVYVETREPVDSLTQEWKSAEEKKKTEQWWQAVDYKKDLIQHPDSYEQCNWSYYAVEGADCYILATYGREGYLNHIDGNTLEIDCEKLSVEGLKADTFLFVGLEVMSGIPVAFIQQWDDAMEETLHYYAGRVNEDGTVELSTDILPAMQEAGIKLEKNYMFTDVKADERGYYYVRNESGAEVYVIDENGNFLYTMESPDGSRNPLRSSYKTAEGVRIFEVANLQDESNSTFYYNEEGIEVLCKSTYEYVNARCMNPYGEIYYFSQGNMVCWNLVDGTLENVYMGTGTEIAETCKAMLYNAAGDVLVFCDGGDSTYVYVLSRNVLKEKVKITVAAVPYADYYFKSYASVFSREHPEVNIEIEEINEDGWTRTMADLAAGQGPDMLLLDRERMIILQKKGVLADLSDVLPTEVTEQIFEGVLQQGSVDGKLYSVIYAASPITLMVSDKVWDKDTWTVEDVLQIIEEREQAGTPITNFVAKQYEDSPDSMFSSFVQDLEHSSFLDLEAGECYFDTEEFRHLLEVCKKYGVVSAKEDSKNLDVILRECRKKVLSGDALAYSSMVLDLFRFGENMEALGEDYICVGYPTEAESGSYLSCYKGIAVNAKTANREAIDEFLQYVMNEENQRETGGLMVRKDVMRNNVVKAEWDNSYEFYCGNKSYRSLVTKEDGSTYVEDYIAFLDSCAAWPTEADAIRAIIWEEVEAYFNGDKDVETVTDIIQSRVKLYLKENTPLS